VVARNSTTDETGTEIDELDSQAGDSRSSSNDDERSPPHMGTVAQVPILLEQRNRSIYQSRYLWYLFKGTAGTSGTF